VSVHVSEILCMMLDASLRRRMCIIPLQDTGLLVSDMHSAHLCSGDDLEQEDIPMSMDSRGGRSKGTYIIDCATIDPTRPLPR